MKYKNNNFVRTHNSFCTTRRLPYQILRNGGLRRYRSKRYGHHHYALLVGLDGANQIAKLLDLNTGKIENIPFGLWREKFELQARHSGPVFTLAKNIGRMKPKTGIYLKKNN